MRAAAGRGGDPAGATLAEATGLARQLVERLRAKGQAVVSRG